jgi:hypothetical protein
VTRGIVVGLLLSMLARTGVAGVLPEDRADLLSTDTTAVV